MASKKYTGLKLSASLIIFFALATVSAHDFVVDIDYDDYTASPTSGSDTDSLHFPIVDAQNLDPAQTPAPSMDLHDPQNIDNSVEYNPEDSTYHFRQQVGGYDIKNPTYMSQEDYQQYRWNKDEEAYWKQKMATLDLFNQKPQLPTLYREGLFDRLFGGKGISIKPQVNLDLTFGGSWQNMKNPTLPQRSQKYGIFDFDMQMNVSLLAQIGDKMKLNITNNTKPTFAEQQTSKLEYTGKEDEIIKKLELGNVDFPLRSTLMTGPRSLFGIKAQLQFGRLWLTGVTSQQSSQMKSVTVQNGGRAEGFEVQADNYEENKNFLLAQYFYNNYDHALEQLPIINSQIQIDKIQVWITNRTGATQGVRDVLAFMDLGEYSPYVPTLTNAAASQYPDNRSNSLYDLLQQNPGARLQATSTQAALSIGLAEGQDFQRNTMRQLTASEFSFQPRLGYISLNTQVNPDDVLAVAYRFTHNGKVYQVGEFAEDMTPDSTVQKVMFLKLLKGISNRPRLPIWNLMMKNIYNLGVRGIAKENFRLNIFYQDPGGGEKRYLPEGPQSGEPIINLLNLDRLNLQGDPAPDGVFDYVEGVTVNSQEGRIIFPVLKPFGAALKPALDGSVQMERKYLYNVLYDSTLTIARQFQQNNRYVLKGDAMSAGGGADIPLGGYNIPQGSVVVVAGGSRLIENVDYQVDYSLGRVKILNAGILSSGIPITIQFEDNAAFGFIQQNFSGVRADYYVNDHLTLGSTYMRLVERPFTNKVSFGDDPIKNTVVGLDANYQNEFPALTRWLDKIPVYSTTAPSLITGSVEVAGVFPGHHRFINSITGDEGGTVFLDDFEGAGSSIDLKSGIQNWSLASTPAYAKDRGGNTLFPEANYSNDIRYGFNRAKIAWYNIEPSLIDGSVGTPDNIKADTALQDYWRQVQATEVFPQRSNISFQNALATFDLGYYPQERGPYNYDVTNIDPSTGRFINPQKRWGGIQRALDNNSTDFEQGNVEYISFWVLDPYIYEPNSAGGDLYINLGNVSEDVLKDSRLAFENGTQVPKDPSKLDKTHWGYVPKFQQQITRAFDNDPAARAVQDVGYDAMDDDEEKLQNADFLSQIANVLAGNPAGLDVLMRDPASDNFHHFRGADYDDLGLSVLQRYKNFNNPHSNSPIADLQQTYTTVGSSIPESEDINRDNTLNETEAYYQYRIRFTPNMQVGTNNIVDKRVVDVKLPNGRMQSESWYQFKIPIRGYDNVIGEIGDFRSIRFMRMFLTDFSDSVVLRFAQLQLDRNNWRRYQFSLQNPGENIPDEDLLTTSFNVNTVSLEQNSTRQPIPYVIPPGIDRQNMAISTGQTQQLDEQSLALQICGLKDGDSRAVYKDVGRFDLRQFEHLKMFIHAESTPNEIPLQNGDMRAFIRIGSDFINNYYEYELPLSVTQPGTNSAEMIWPEANRLDITLQDLINLKTTRNNNNLPSFIPYSSTDVNGQKITIVGNPNIAEVKNIMIGVRNPLKTLQTPNDNGLPICGEVWFDELRVTGLNEKPAYAAAGQVNIQMADLGSVHLGGSMHTVGYGNIDQKVNERFRDNLYQYDATTNLNMGKLLPNKWGVQLPVFAGYTQSISNPEYDPYDKDIKLIEKIKNSANGEEVRKDAQDFMSITSFSLNNMRFTGNPESKNTKAPMPWSGKNFDITYTYNRAFKRNPLVESDELTTQHLGIGYVYNIKTKTFEPFKKLIKSPSKWWSPIKDFNINLLPSNFSFRTDLDKIFGETIVRNIDKDDQYEIPPFYYKNFTWGRNYNLRWELTKSLSFNYQANNVSRIDEPYGRIDSREKRDTLWNNFSRFGRNTFYTQNLSASYNLPTKKFPFLDWTTVTATYTSSYNWTAASLLAHSQGNIIANTQLKQINGELNFTMLYNKNRWLKAVTQPKNNGINVNSSNLKGVKDMSINSNNRNEGNGTINKNNDREAKRFDKSGGGKGGDQNGDNNAIGNGKGNDKNNNNDNKIDNNKNNKSGGGRSQPSLPPKPTKKEIKPEDVKGHDTMSSSQLANEIAKLKKKERQRFRKEMIAWRAKKNNILPQVSGGERFVGGLATMLKRVTLNYSENYGTVLPGYMDSTRFFGMNNNGWNPGTFAFGYQPDKKWLDQQAEAGRISSDSIFNGQMQQRYAQTFNLTAAIEPIRDMRIDVSWKKDFSKNHQEIFKYDYDMFEYQHFNPSDMGTFSVSYMALGTLFRKSSSESLSQTFKDFLNNRAIISARLGNTNPYTGGILDPEDPNYYKGYTGFSQDVLIPAFIAAYTGRDASKVPLIDYSNENIRSNPFKYYFPLPNWKLSYNGLARMPSLRDKITNFTISNSYTCNMSMNSFITNFYYQDLLGVGFPSFIDSNSHNYVPFFQVPNLTITEQFSPILGIDASFKNSLTFRVQFNKTRMMSLSLIDYQVSETNSTEYVIGGGYRIKGLHLPFTIFGVRELKNDINIRVDLGYRNDETFNTYLAGMTQMATRGQKVITISPTIDYIINDNLQLRLFYDRRQTVPVMSTSYPITTTRAGLTLRFLFTEK